MTAGEAGFFATQMGVGHPNILPTTVCAVVEHGEPTELDEVVAAPARAELRPGAILESSGDVGTRQSASMTSC